MKILVVTQYFWPESFRINDLVLGLQERGHHVTVLTGKPNYPKGKFFEGYSFWRKRDEEWNGIKIYRSNLLPRGKGGGLRLMANYLTFAFFASLKSFGKIGNFDKIFVYEPSPITVGLPAILLGKRKKIPVFFWVQDLWPESVSAAGQFNNPSVLRLINTFTKWIYKNCRKVLIQSEGFRPYILNQGVPDNKIVFYPNSIEAYFKPLVVSRKIKALLPQAGFIVMFAGNIGESQDFETIIEAAKIIRDRKSNVQFVILGEGRKKKFVEEHIKELDLLDSFHLLGSFPSEFMPEFYAGADALLVSLKNDKIFDLTIPSKLQSYLACGKPIIGSLNGEGAKIIEKANAGFVAPSGQPQILAQKIIKLSELDTTRINKMGKDAKEYSDNNFERELLLDKLIEILNETT